MKQRETMNYGASCELRPAERVTGCEPYRSPVPPAAIELSLSGNEGATPPTDLLASVRNASAVARRYPDFDSLERRIAARFQHPREGVIITAGADDALFRAVMALLAPGREMILPTPTFEMLERYARLAGGDVRPINWSAGAYPTDAIIAAASERTAIIAVVSPNNPTGAVATVDDLQRLSAAAPQALLLVDLAYVEFADVDPTSAALALPNALVVRTFSKARGLAGLRVGYALGPPEVIRWLRCVGQPYAVSGISAVLAEESLVCGDARLQAFVSRVREERDALTRLLGECGAEPSASQGNFVLARFADATAVWRALAELGVAVRAFAGHPLLHEYLRITCPGEPAAFERLAAALKYATNSDRETQI